MQPSECWIINIKEELKIKVVEMRMLRRMCGGTKMDKINNEYIKGSLGVMNIAGKMRANRLKQFGHDENKNNDDIVKNIASQKEQ